MDMDELEKMRLQADKRFKNEGYTIRQLKARKDVDRHPMFHLRVTIKDSRPTNVGENQFGDESTLPTVMEVLEAMITQWLSAHHFRPQQRRRKRERPDTASSNHGSPAASSMPSTVGPLSTLLQPRISRPRTAETSSKSGKRTRSNAPGLNQLSARSQSRVFADWSRIKSGKADFFDKVPSSRTVSALRGQTSDPDPSQATSSATERFASFDVESLQQGSLSLQATRATHDGSGPEALPVHDAQDDTILWTDPETKKTYLLNARTGCVVPDLRSRPNTTSSLTGPVLSQKTINKSLRLPQRPATASAAETPWLANVLQSWENPVFKSSERRIQQVGLHEPELGHSNHSHGRLGCSQTDIEKAFGQVTADTKSETLSKQGLQHAEVIAQVDKKFILVKMRPSPDAGSNGQATDLLVLIDQHAADERIQVEELFRKLCTPVTDHNGSRSYKSKLGHQAQVTSTHLEKPLQYTISQVEATHFTAHAARFATWGILFDITNSTRDHTAAATKQQALLSVTTLPPAIAERCKSDPKILITFLRSSVWKHVEDPHLPVLPPPNANASDSNVAGEADWVRRLANCPPDLIGMINSRACRSAIMFNDVLDMKQCRDLVKKLADCVFPFMCAHGRPSMVPLVDLGSLGDVHSSADIEAVEGEKTDFVGVWKTWTA
ncbi:hypothetical protein NX059_009096 [Plenodomus lindquistii]|nr:hypothetical protein NX059_009096 [Plenodomus lindquistii]